MSMRKVAFSLLGLIVLCGSALAADEFKIDPGHSSVGFSVRHMTISTVHGRFNDYSGTIVFDPDPTKCSVNVTIKTASVNTDNQNRDNDLRSPNFFDVQKYPEITFQSKSVAKKGDSWVAHGTLTIHGVSKDVDLPFTLSGPVSMGRGKRLGAEAGLTINRQDYGLNYSKTLDNGGLLVGNDVKIEITIEAQQAPAAPPAATPGK